MNLFLIGAYIFIRLVACFMDDPKYLFPRIQLEQFRNGASWECEFPSQNYYSDTQYWYDNSLQKFFQQFNLTQEQKAFYKYTNIVSSFPLTINCNVNSFQSDNSKIKRLVLLYWNKNHKWSILKDIKNTEFVNYNDVQKKALFGKYVFGNSMGFKNRQMLFICCYFETQNGNKTHDNLTEMLTKTTVNTLPHNVNGVIKIGVSDNKKPI